MFKDYYHILEISYPSNNEDIKKAYRNQSFKWHPDRNKNQQALEQMQDINEAYNILRNIESKHLYDIEYELFQQTILNNNQKSTYYEHNEYNVHDETLKNDINKARKEAKEYVENLVNSLKTDSSNAVKGAWDEMKPYLWVGFILFLIALSVQTCS